MLLSTSGVGFLIVNTGLDVPPLPFRRSKELWKFEESIHLGPFVSLLVVDAGLVSDDSGQLVSLELVNGWVAAYVDWQVVVGLQLAVGRQVGVGFQVFGVIEVTSCRPTTT